MPMKTRVMVLVAAGLSFLTIAAMAQDSDSPPLGDLARQQRQQRDQAKAAQAKEGKETKVITNADLPAHSEDPAPAVSDDGKAEPSTASHEPKQGSEEMKSRIQDEKHAITELQQRIEEINGSIRFAPENCVRNCVQWNERQERKQQEVQQMQSRLDEEKRHLEEMQESARKQGFGSSVYDP
jgi:hypothetical protein